MNTVGQPMEQTRSLFCTCNPDLARCQSQTGVTFGERIRCSKRIAGQVGLALSIKFCVVHEVLNSCNNLNID